MTVSSFALPFLSVSEKTAAEHKGVLTVVPLTEKSGQTVAVLTW